MLNRSTLFSNGLMVLKNEIVFQLFKYIPFIILLLFSGRSFSQAPEHPTASKILLDMKKLNVLGTVLYMAAHPDDENTMLITYMSNEKLYNTGYLSLTRGDGGQNLIGPEIREKLGIIRTQELLQARRTDGGKQFFTRAVDFGFSKSPEETFTIWNREQVLSDAVWVIRKFRPDVMITRFPKDSRAGHGHHSASSILAEEAFDAAADPKRFPEQLKYVQVWQVKRLLWNTSSWAFKSASEFSKYAQGFLKIDIGGFNPLLGKSYGEISAESRSMHKSQGFGSTGRRGESIEYFEHTKGEKATNDLFDGINTSWSRVSGSANVSKLIQKAVTDYTSSNPAAVVPTLLAALKEMRKLPDSYWKPIKIQELQNVIQDAMGLYMEVTAGDFDAAPETQVQLKVEVINRSAVPAILENIRYGFAGKDTSIQVSLKEGQDYNFNAQYVLPADVSISQPYWLRKPGTVGMFSIESQQEVGLPENVPATQVELNLRIGGELISFNVPVVYKRTDPVSGEIYRPFVINPPVFLNLAENVYMFASAEPRQVSVLVKAGKDNLTGTIALQLPTGWRAEPASIPVSMNRKDDEKQVTFTVYPSANQQVGELKMIATIEGKKYDKSLNVINYAHIPAQVDFPDATARVVRLDLKKKNTKIGYLMGAGDDVPQSLHEIGYEVTILQEKDMTLDHLKQFGAVILGVRAYNTVPRLRYYQADLMKYAEEGGTVIVQYNVDQSLLMTNIGPYPLKLSRDRVTDENSKIRF
ncbi:hypothetical protein ADIARSV_0685 [Arcticibacter svalbardensis MN12-7]|uniref:LmbE family protein n=1 Tax=Arcticibacter svalbardensis MN12-7 TaxID=1150600 RepID=R9GWK7_9SPHI|nr:PIG-L family deacetylase [Arcticibacter svalbardensis]EOR96172.1 hypothetical protein ADIARSV_0685 [Arcticibacter svalbardensis MN12-7]